MLFDMTWTSHVQTVDPFVLFSHGRNLLHKANIIDIENIFLENYLKAFKVLKLQLRKS